MTSGGHKLLTRALALSEPDRLDLAQQLLESVISPDSAVALEEHRTREILDECRRRIERYRRGETGAKPVLEVFPELASDISS